MDEKKIDAKKKKAIKNVPNIPFKGVESNKKVDEKKVSFKEKLGIEKKEPIDPLAGNKNLDDNNPADKAEKPQMGLNKWALVLGVFVIILLAAFVVRPTIQGYSVYQQIADTGLEEYGKNIGEIAQRLTASETELEVSTLFNDELLNRVNQVADDIAICAAEKELCLQREKEFEQKIVDKETEVETSLAGMEDTIAEKVEKRTEELKESNRQCHEDLIDKEDELDDLDENFDDFAGNAARRICCKEKVDNSQINSYEVVENKLVCLEEGGNALSC